MARIDVNKIGISRFIIDNIIIFKLKLSICRDNDGNLAEAAHLSALGNFLRVGKDFRLAFFSRLQMNE